MVTHDVGLKDFADRVIWMRDGKIKFVEVTSKDAKQKRLQKLKDELETISKGEKKSGNEFQSTFIRKPTDYETHPKFTTLRITKFEFPEDFKCQNSEPESKIDLIINASSGEESDSMVKLSDDMSSVLIV